MNNEEITNQELIKKHREEVNRFGANADPLELYCDDCGFLFSEAGICKRVDGKYFCRRCCPRKQYKLKEPNEDFCSECGFEESARPPFMKRRDGHYFHRGCANAIKK